MKVTTYETLYMKNMVLLWSTIYETHYMRNKVPLWSTSVEKEIVALPFLFIFYFFGPLFFSFFWPFYFLFGQCSNNDDHHTFIYWQLNITTRYLEQRYDSIWMPPAVYRDVQWSSVAKISKKRTSHENIMLAVLRSCKAIWQWMLKSCIWWWWTERWKVVWRYILEWLWKCHDR